DREPEVLPRQRVHPAVRRRRAKRRHRPGAERAHRRPRRPHPGHARGAPEDRRRAAPRGVNPEPGTPNLEPGTWNPMGLIGSYNLRSMIVRKATAAMTALGIAMVVAVFVMTLAIAQGFRATLVASGSPQNAIVLRKSATSENVSS